MARVTMASGITYVPMARGFVYLVAIVDWFSRGVLAWRLSITLSADFCVGPWRRRSRGTASQCAEESRGGDQHGRQGRLA